MIAHPAFRTVFRPQAPVVTLLDLQTSTVSNGGAASTYTFSNCNLGAIGGHAMDESIMGVQNNASARNIASRSPSNSYLLLIVHTRNAVANNAVTACRIGGVAGRILVSVTSTVAGQVHLATWPMSALLGITNTDIAVDELAATDSVTVAPLLVTNVPGLATTLVSSSAGSASGAVNLTGGTPSFERVGRNLLQICATSTTLTQTANASISLSGRYSGFREPTLLYDQSNTSFNYACAYSYIPGYLANSAANQISVTWGGAISHQAIAATLD